eukprot:jgi/Mesvir1/11215/Mv03064-RA.1
MGIPDAVPGDAPTEAKVESTARAAESGDEPRAMETSSSGANQDAPVTSQGNAAEGKKQRRGDGRRRKSGEGRRPDKAAQPGEVPAASADETMQSAASVAPASDGAAEQSGESKTAPEKAPKKNSKHRPNKKPADKQKSPENKEAGDTANGAANAEAGGGADVAESNSAPAKTNQKTEAAAPRPASGRGRHRSAGARKSGNPRAPQGEAQGESKGEASVDAASSTAHAQPKGNQGGAQVQGKGSNHRRAESARQGDGSRSAHSHGKQPQANGNARKPAGAGAAAGSEESKENGHGHGAQKKPPSQPRAAHQGGRPQGRKLQPNEVQFIRGFAHNPPIRASNLHSEAPPVACSMAPEVGRFLETVRIKEFLEKKGDYARAVTVLTTEHSLGEAMATLYDQDILASPVQDPEKEGFVGFIDVLDILSYLLEFICEKDAKNGDLNPYTYPSDPDELDELGQKCLANTKVGDVVDKSHRDPFFPISEYGNVYQLVEDLFSRGVHRAPVIDEDGTIVGIVTQSDVARLLAMNIDRLGAATDKTLEELLLAANLAAGNVIAMSGKASAIHAFLLMLYNKVRAVAIVSTDGKLVAELSASNLRGIHERGLGALLQPVSEFLMDQQLLKPSAAPRLPMMASAHTQFGSVLTNLGIFRAHRLWVVNEQHKPIGVVSLTDVIQMIAN